MINFKKLFYLIVFTLFGVANVACVSMLPEAHKIDIHQGNIIDSERLAKLEIGMSQEQVKYLLGSPVSTNLFRTDRWDYLHYISKAGSYAKPKRITIFFVNGAVSKIENHYSSE